MENNSYPWSSGTTLFLYSIVFYHILSLNYGNKAYPLGFGRWLRALPGQQIMAHRSTTTISLIFQGKTKIQQEMSHHQSVPTSGKRRWHFFRGIHFLSARLPPRTLPISPCSQIISHTRSVLCNLINQNTSSTRSLQTVICQWSGPQASTRPV